jgi:hypothetical protein
MSITICLDAGSIPADSTQKRATMARFATSKKILSKKRAESPDGLKLKIRRLMARELTVRSRESLPRP